jgi:hypothetical protein
MQIKILPVRLRINAPPAVAISLKNRTPNPIVRLFVDELRAFVSPLMKGRRAAARAGRKFEHALAPESASVTRHLGLRNG